MENNELAHQLLCGHCVCYYGGRTAKVKILTTKLLTSPETSDIIMKKTLIFWAAHSKKLDIRLANIRKKLNIWR